MFSCCNSDKKYEHICEKEIPSRTWVSKITESKEPEKIKMNLLGILESDLELKTKLYLDIAKIQEVNPVSRKDIINIHQEVMHYFSQEILRKRERVGIERTYFLIKLIICTILLSSIPPIVIRYPSMRTDF